MKMLFVCLLFNMIYHTISLSHNFKTMISLYSYITMKINQIGKSRILPEGSQLPNEVYINNIKQDFPLSHY